MASLKLEIMLNFFVIIIAAKHNNYNGMDFFHLERSIKEKRKWLLMKMTLKKPFQNLEKIWIAYAFPSKDEGFIERKPR